MISILAATRRSESADNRGTQQNSRFSRRRVGTLSRQRPSNGGKYDASLIVRNQECPELACQP